MFRWPTLKAEWPNSASTRFSVLHECPLCVESELSLYRNPTSHNEDGGTMAAVLTLDARMPLGSRLLTSTYCCCPCQANSEQSERGRFWNVADHTEKTVAFLIWPCAEMDLRSISGHRTVSEDESPQTIDCDGVPISVFERTNKGVTQ